MDTRLRRKLWWTSHGRAEFFFLTQKLGVAKEFNFSSNAMGPTPNPSKNKVNFHAECSPESNVFRIYFGLKMMLVVDF